MDNSLYKQITVRRSLIYSYYYSAPKSTQPTLLFLHGFPSTSHDWKRQIVYFQAKGYGIVAPDMLGSGGTSRPVDSAAFRMNLMAADIIELLDQENLVDVVGIGHDWGCNVLSRLSMLYSERFSCFAWMGLSFMEPITSDFDLDGIMKIMKNYLGYEGYAYWKFFERDDASDIIEKNVDSFIQLLYPNDPDLWLSYMALPGKTTEWMESNMQPGFAHYLTTEDIDHIRRNVLAGIHSGLNWYRSQLHNNDLDDNLKIPEADWTIKKPSFFAVALKDCICTPKRGKATMDKFGTNVTTIEFQTGHWIHLEATETLNKEFDLWLQNLKRCT